MQSASYAYADFVEFVRNVAAVRIFEIEGHDARFGVASVDGRADVFERIYNVFRYSENSVPASKDSGIATLGITSFENVPVPPYKIGFRFTSFLTSKNPVPCMP